MVNAWIDRYCRLLGLLMVACLALMVVLVFGNVVMRYAFNSGIAISDELSRWLFVWMAFMGAVVAVREHGHLGTDFLVGRLPRWGKKIFLGIGQLLMIYICWLLLQGSLAQTRINAETTSAVMEAPVSYFYASGVMFAVSAGLLLALDFLRLVTGRTRDEQLVAIQESEENSHPGADARHTKDPRA